MNYFLHHPTNKFPLELVLDNPPIKLKIFGSGTFIFLFNNLLLIQENYKTLYSKLEKPSDVIQKYCELEEILNNKYQNDFTIKRELLTQCLQKGLIVQLRNIYVVSPEADKILFNPVNLPATLSSF